MSSSSSNGGGVFVTYSVPKGVTTPTTIQTHLPTSTTVPVVTISKPTPAPLPLTGAPLVAEVFVSFALLAAGTMAAVSARRRATTARTTVPVPTADGSTRRRTRT